MVLRIRVTKAALTIEFGEWGKYYKIAAMPNFGRERLQIVEGHLMAAILNLEAQHKSGFWGIGIFIPSSINSIKCCQLSKQT